MSKSKMVVDKYGNKRWVDIYDVLHRLDGPAIIHPDGLEEWYQDGQLHRKDGPAAIYPDGGRVWSKKTKHFGPHNHREDGAAVITMDGCLIWYKHGEVHREDGPAVIQPNGEVTYWMHDQPISRIEFEKVYKNE